MVDQLIDEIIKRESSKDTNDPNDPGGETKFGIAKRFHPEVWNPGPPTYQQAHDIYMVEYIVKPGFAKIDPAYIGNQLADWGVTSGPVTAIQHLQKVLSVTVDGVMGPATYLTISKRDPLELNNQLVDDHILFIDRLVQKRPSDVEYLFGWHTRALSFRK